MALSKECESRIYNWKFSQAKEYVYVSGADTSERKLVGALATVFGDCGWFDDGCMSTIIAAAVSTLIAEEAGQ